MEKPVNQDPFAGLRSKLEARRDRLRKELQVEKSGPASIESDSQDAEVAYIGDLDKGVELAVGEHHLLELRDIDDALQRMEAGTYGVCQDCGEVIDRERLDAYPMARRCLGCKQLFERE